MISYDTILKNMIEDYKSLSGSQPHNCSDISIRFKTIASQIFSVYSKLDWLTKQIFPQTASDIFLDYHAQTRGLSRKKSSPASGILKFSTCSPATADILIPKDTICYSISQPSLRFATTQNVTLKTGTSFVDAPAISLQNNLSSNIPTGTALQIINPPQSIQTVSSPQPFSGGCNDESDQELRDRLLDSFSHISNGSNSAFYRDIAMNHDKVSSVNVLPRNRGRGTVDVIIASGNTIPSSELIQTVQNSLQKAKEINVDVSVLPVKFKKLDLSIQIQIQPSFSISTVTETCTSSIQNFFANLKIAQPLNVAVLGKEILSLPGITNYKITSPNVDITPHADEVIVLNDIKISPSD